MLPYEFIQFWEKHKGKTIGSLLGLVFSLLVLSYGFLKAIFIFLCVGIFYSFGKRIDERKDFRAFLNRLINGDDK